MWGKKKEKEPVGEIVYNWGSSQSVEKVGEIIDSPHFEDVVFSPKLSNFIKLVLEKLKKERLNLLFSGYAGTGKTYSSKMIACETGKPFIYINGAMSKNRIVELMLNAKENALVLIDEIHNLPEKICEIIYSAIQDNEIYDEGKRKPLGNISFIGTTTEPESLPKPLLDRFMRIEFEEPDEDSAKAILKKMGLADADISKMINYTLNIRILKKIVSYMEMYDEDKLVNVFRLMKINVYSGMSDEQEKYINYIKSVGKASLRNLSLVLRRSDEYIKRDVEPDLIRKSLILITSRGRELNPEIIGYKDLVKEGEKDHSEKTLDEVELAKKYLNENLNIKKKFGKRYSELVQFIADKICEGISPEEIDFYSFGEDIGIAESYENNYKSNYLEEL